MLNKERAHYFASVLTHRAQGRLLDVGCGSGGFLDALKNEDIGQWELCGLEPSQHAAAVACDKGYNVECALLGHETYAPESFDAVSLVSVLEHMEHPVQTMSAIRRLLKPDGVVYVEVPSVLYPELSLTGNFSVEHILHFSPGSLTKLFHQSGFSDVMNDPLIEDFGLRLIGSRDLGAWGQTRLASYVDDPAHVRDVVTAYADAEKELIDMILRRVGKALEAWKAKGLRVAVYGAGLHTLELMSVLDLHDYCAVCLDADPKKQGTEFLGFEVHAPENLVQLGIEAVLVSSHRFQTEIEEAVRAIAGPSLEIAVCYDADYSTHCTLT